MTAFLLALHLCAVQDGRLACGWRDLNLYATESMCRRIGLSRTSDGPWNGYRCTPIGAVK